MFAWSACGRVRITADAHVDVAALCIIECAAFGRTEPLPRPESGEAHATADEAATSRRAPVAPVGCRETADAQRLKAARREDRAAFAFSNDWACPSVDPELVIRMRCLLSGTAVASDTNVVYARRSSCTLVTVGSASSILTTRFPTTRRSREPAEQFP